MDGRPWSFDHQLLVLQEFDGKTHPSQMVFTQSIFWVQIHDMPLVCMNRMVGTRIGESIGAVEDIDVEDDGTGWGRYLCVRVLIDIMKLSNT